MNNSKASTFYSGTSGLVLPIVRELYPAEFQGKSRLNYYASLFNSLEINSSFYKLPRTSTIIKWAESTPHNFQFTFKLSKTITHAKGLQFSYEDVELFIKTIDNIGSKKGCVLVQLPPALKTEKINQFQNLLKSINKADSNNGWKLAVEFRNKAWYTDHLYKLLQQYNVGLVLHDLPASATPHKVSTTDFVYVRFHGTEQGYRGNYSNDFLLEYAKKITLWIDEGKTIYCYFNNTLGNAVSNLQTLNRFVMPNV